MRQDDDRLGLDRDDSDLRSFTAGALAEMGLLADYALALLAYLMRS